MHYAILIVSNLKSLGEYNFNLRNLQIYYIVFIFFIIFISFSGSQTFSELIGLGNSSMILSNTTFNSLNPYFAVSNDSIFAVWVSNLSSNNSDIMFKKINDFSKSYSNTVNVSNAPGISNLAKLNVNDYNVYVTWEDKQSDKWNLLFSKSHNKGNNFDPIINLSDSTGNVHLHDLSSSGTNVFVVWAANENISSSNKEVFFRKSNDGGDSFNYVLNLSHDHEDSLDPFMTINENGSIIYIVWTKCAIKNDDPECGVAFARSLDRGYTFTDPKIIDVDKFLTRGSISIRKTAIDVSSKGTPSYLSDNSTLNERVGSINPIVFTSGDGKQVYIIWEQNTFGKGDSEILLKASNDYGDSFKSTINISNSSGTSRLAHGDILGEDLYVAWADTLNQTGIFDILVRKINPEVQLGKVLNLSNNSGNSVSPYLRISNNDKIYLTWIDSSNNSSIFLSRIDPSGSTFTKELFKSELTVVITNPIIIETRDKLWISWTELTENMSKVVLMKQDKF